jgi:hypothetical protein
MNPPCKVTPAPPGGTSGPGKTKVLVTTGSRQEKSTAVTGMSTTALGVVLGLGETVAGAVSLAEAEGLGLELMTAFGRGGPQAIRTKATIASRRLIVASNGPEDHPLRDTGTHVAALRNLVAPVDPTPSP